MGKVIVVTSGKGGVGKTTSTAALGAALLMSGCIVPVDRYHEGRGYYGNRDRGDDCRDRDRCGRRDRDRDRRDDHDRPWS